LAYDNDWNRFYQEELKFKLHFWASSAVIVIGSTLAFVRPWVGTPIMLVGLLTHPKVQNWLSQKLNKKYDTWTKGTVIASLLTVSFAANGVYSDNSNKKIAEQAQIEKIKTDETERINREKQIRIDSVNYYVQLASQNIKDKKHKAAEDNLQKAYDINPESQEIIYYRGYIYQCKGKYNKALEEYDKISLVPGLQVGELEYQKGQCYINIGKKEEALFAFQSSGDLGFEKGGQLYKKYKPKPKPTPKIRDNTNPSTSSYSAGGTKRSGGCLAGQCTAYTKKGYRCSRTTTSCSGRCWQH
jgi:hypothetical protein